MADFQNLIQRGLRSAQPAATAVPAGTLYFVTDESVTERSTGAAWQDYSDGGAAGGDSTTTAAKASRPAAANDGDLFLASNGIYIERDTGAAWAPWGPLFPFTEPIDGDFAWINQASATVVTTFGGIVLASPADTNGLRIRKKAAPSVPYTITAAFLVNSPFVNSHHFGLCFRQSGDGKVHTFGVQVNTGVGTYPILGSYKWTSPTVFSASYLQLNYWRYWLMFLRIADDNTNRICSISHDGQTWQTIHSVGRTDFLTADEVGFFVEANNVTYPFPVTLLSWKQG